MHRLIRAGVAAASIASMLTTSGFAFAHGHGHEGHGYGRQHGHRHGRQFTDVGQVPWAQAGISAMQAQGVLQGVAPGQFDPGGLLTRAQMAAILGRLFGWQQGNNSGGVDFADEGSIPGYALPYVGIASRKGILRGLPGRRFMPGGHITWAQLAVIVARAYGYAQVPSTQVPALLQQLPYGAQTPPWAAEAVAQDVQAGDFSGLMASVYRPDADVSRAELAQFLVQVEGQPGSGSSVGTNQNVLSGQVTAVNGLSWTIETTGGSQTVTVSPSASVFAESTPSNTSAVQVGDQVTLVEAGGQVVVVNITGGTTVSQATGLTGSVVSVGASQIVLSIPGIPSLTLAVAPNASVTVNGAASSLSAIGPNQTVTVQLNSAGQVVTIVAGSSSGTGTTTGTVLSFANDQLFLSSGGVTSTYSVSPAASVTLNGQPSNLSAVVPNETVTLTLSGDQVTAIDVLSGTAAGSLSVVTTTLPSATVNAYYTQTLTATGGSGGYTWTYQSGTLPPGLSVNSNGVVTGTPSAAGSYTFDVQVRDSQNDTATGQYTISVGSVGSGLAVTNTSLPSATVNAYYTQTLTATGGSGGYTWTYQSGTLPPGLSVNSNGVVTGTPSAAGSYTFDVQVRDSQNDTATGQYTISVGSVGSGLAVTNTSLPSATVNAYYTQSLTATGGSGGYTWTYQSGTLPPGLSVSSNGVVTGTPSAAGSYTFDVQVRDSQNDTATGQYTISVGSVGSGLAVTNTSLPSATVNANYTQTLTATGGSGGYTWMYQSGTLPPGLSVASDGVISGTPTTLGSYTFDVQVRDSQNDTATGQYTVNVTQSGSALTIATVSLPSATVNSSYAQALVATGGSGSYVWTIASGSLPPGMNLSGDQITGVSGSLGTYTFTVEVQDASNTSLTGTRTLSITVVN